MHQVQHWHLRRSRSAKYLNYRSSSTMVVVTYFTTITTSSSSSSSCSSSYGIIASTMGSR
ncbi:hypothetical protein M0804_015494 [Polistes exclamans]|nr:hypothetical protein M0804_015494 [Polistes exclamans]